MNKPLTKQITKFAPAEIARLAQLQKCYFDQRLVFSTDKAALTKELKRLANQVAKAQALVAQMGA